MDPVLLSLGASTLEALGMRGFNCLRGVEETAQGKVLASLGVYSKEVPAWETRHGVAHGSELWPESWAWK